MSPRRQSCVTTVLVALSFLGAPALRAADITLQGTFGSDDAVQLFDIVLNTTGNVDLRSYGYAGGIPSNGHAIPRGGFDPVLTLFDAAGVFIVENDDGAGAATDPLTQQAFDTRITSTLSVGRYILALTQYDNFVQDLPWMKASTKRDAGTSRLTRVSARAARVLPVSFATRLIRRDSAATESGPSTSSTLRRRPRVR